jgi:penicillin-binding protein 2
MGVRLGVDLPSEDRGMIADTGFYNRLYRGVWNSCNNVFLGIGQGEMTATPLQMANLMCIIANKGYYYTPHFVSSIDGGGEADTLLTPFQVRHEVTRISAETYEEVQLGMQDVVEKGTARIARLQGIAVAAKTGTSENYGIIGGKRIQLDDHSWFVAFAPRENPRIAIAVIVENAGFGATWAGPIASLLMERYLTDTLRPERLAEVERIASKEIMLPVIRQKRMRQDSLRRIRMHREAADTPSLPRGAIPSTLRSLPATPASGKPRPAIALRQSGSAPRDRRPLPFPTPSHPLQAAITHPHTQTRQR